MFDTYRKAIVAKIVDALCDVQAKALVHLVQPVIARVAGEVREAVASGRGMTDEEVERRVAELLKPLLEEEESAMGEHITAMVAAQTNGTKANTDPAEVQSAKPAKPAKPANVDPAN